MGADRVARRAIAQAYGHAILPLCNDRDLRTQIRWGLADFRHRFGREAEGLWLPETAVDDRVLAALAEEGVGFTILAPNQVAAVRDPGGDWELADAREETRLPGTLRWRHPTRPDLGVDLVVYDGPISHDVAFGGFRSQVVVDRIVERSTGDLVSVACDGESFGHHHAYADRGVAYALAVEADRRGVELPRLADWLADHPPTREGRVHVSAWSCAHGVARWMEDCGCHTGGEPGWNQAWRGPLRAAFDRVRDWAVEVFERRGPEVLARPVGGPGRLRRARPGRHHGRGLHRRPRGRTGDDDAVVTALTLLESQRHALLMYTSCGWFFNDLAGIETVQIMRYAACCCDLLAELGEPAPVDAVLATLAEARSNDPAEGDGREIWHRHVETSRVDPARVAAHLALTDLLAGDAAAEHIAGFELERELHETVDRGGVAVCAGRVAITHRRTRRRTRWAYAALHLGGLEVFGAVRPAADHQRDARDVAALVGDTRRAGRVTGLLRMVVDRFGPREFGLESALPGVGEDLLRATAQGLADRFVAAYDQLRSDHHDTLAALAVAGTPLAPELGGPIELALARRLGGALAAAVTSRDPAAYRGVRALAREAREEGVRLSSPAAAATLTAALTRAVEEATARPDRAAVEAAGRLVTLARELALDVDMDVAQERIHEALRPGGAADADRELLVPLARRLGVSSRPIHVHG